ncbi:type 1 glutamine amidotransferase [Limosilactobacillus gorillae]|uniref:type 1 glutamine amidotransferase n=1 Tax=Limosilactobacillus gorillae TaxID=1450649 RepID=UPI000A9AD747|nr:type 1 glutamine amidotransferase [Limosilactobacillus gorillae]
MRVNVLQHVSDEGPGAILNWAAQKKATVTIYHPNDFGILPTVDETDLLVVLGSPASPNDDDQWIKDERILIKEMLSAKKPLFGACFGAQQIAMVLGGKVKDAPAKEVGWLEITKQTDLIPDLPDTAMPLHWHQQMFTIPEGAQLLYSSKYLREQGFIYQNLAIGLQCHLEPLELNVREMCANDGAYAVGSVLNQSANEIVGHGVPIDNQRVMNRLLDYLMQQS